MTSPTLGFIINTSDDGPTPAIFSDMSVLGLCLPSDDADPAMFPLNTPVDVNTGEQAVLAALGTGDLYKTILMINEQLADFEAGARCVVVRVAQGGTLDETITNILGDPAARTGIYAFLDAPARLGVVPRLLGAPGYTGKVTYSGGATGVTRSAHSGMVGNGVMTLASPAYLTGAQSGTYKVVCIGGAKAATSAAKTGGNTGNGLLGSLTVDAAAVSGAWRVICAAPAANGGEFLVLRPDRTFDGIANVGAAYHSAQGPNFTLTDGSTDFVAGDEFVVTVADVVPANGGTFSVKDPHGVALANAVVGTPYATQIAFTIADGSTDFAIADEFDVVVTITGGQVLANPICVSLPEICSSIPLAHAIVGAYVPGGTNSKADEIAWRTTLNSRRLIPVGNAVIDAYGNTIDHAAVVMGLGVKSDFSHGGVPATVFGNLAVQGIVGFLRYDSFALVDGATTGQELFAAGIGILARGEAVEVAAAASGFISLSSRNADTDTIWWNYNKSRIRDYTHLALITTIRKRLLVENVTPHGVQAVINDMTDIAATIKRRRASIGFQVYFKADDNSPSDLRLGKFTVGFKQEEPAPITLIDIESSTDYPALTVELQEIIQDVSTTVTSG